MNNRTAREDLQTGQHISQHEAEHFAVELEAVEGLPAASFPFKHAEDGQELQALLRQLRGHPIDATGLTLERAAIPKCLCDAYLIRRFETMAQNATE